MRGNKIVILLLAFVLPISIFIFLKTLGKNEFAVDPLYQTGVIETIDNCELKHTTPYTVSESVMKAIRWNSENSLSLYVFKNNSFDEQAIVKQMSEKFNSNDLLLYTVLDGEEKSRVNANTIETISLDDSIKAQLQFCHFIIGASNNSVLIDQQRRIRGHYNLAERAEVDRLIVEVEIILKKY